MQELNSSSIKGNNVYLRSVTCLCILRVSKSKPLSWNIWVQILRQNLVRMKQALKKTLLCVREACKHFRKILWKKWERQMFKHFFEQVTHVGRKWWQHEQIRKAKCFMMVFLFHPLYAIYSKITNIFFEKKKPLQKQRKNATKEHIWTP